MPARNVPLERNGPEPLFASDSLKSAPPALNFFIPSQFRELYRKVVQTENQPILEALLAEMKIGLRVDPADMRRIPATGPVIAVANHPFGMLDGVILGALALRVRNDVKILANRLLAAIPELAPHCFFVDPFDHEEFRHTNSRGLRQAISHLRGGGMLIVFPAGEVSHWQFKYGEISDPEWSDMVARMAQATRSAVLPVLFMGANSVPFHLMGLIHPMLRTARLPHELLNKSGKEIEVRIGNMVSAEKLRDIRHAGQATDYLRWRTYLLDQRGGPRPFSWSWKFPLTEGRAPAAVASPLPDHDVLAELRMLGAEGRLCENREFRVYAARGHQIPNLLAEIGRQRELTFREVGEGTGKAIDLDQFDSYYTHLILWNKPKNELAGAYRLANSEEVLRSRGSRGLYTSSLFAFDARFFEQMGPALELGRSFIRSEYQKQYGSLLMLWKGIGAYVARHPETPTLFGAVSISNSYTRASRELMVRFFQSHEYGPLAKLVRPKSSLRQRRKLRRWEISSISRLLDLDDLSNSVAELEKDGKGIPILLRQYLKVGGKILSFNVDKSFSNVLDGLILVDLRKTDPGRLETYMSKQGVEGFRKYHGLPETALHGTGT